MNHFFINKSILMQNAINFTQIDNSERNELKHKNI